MRRIRNFIRGGGGGPGPMAGKQPGQRRVFFLLCFFIVLNLFYS